MIGITALMPIAGQAISGVGSAFVGSLSGIGRATQTLIAGGVAMDVKNRFFK